MNHQSPAEGQNPTSIEIVTDFACGAQGWSAGFCDFPLGDVDLGLAAGIRPLPESLGLPGTGYYLTGMNRPDDLFMFLTTRLTGQDGIRPDGMYGLEFEIQFASDAPSGMAGAGGAPGDSVYLKAGGGPLQPTPIISPGGSAGEVRINIDKGPQSRGGPFAGVVGNIANGRRPDQPPQYVLLTQRYRHPKPVVADGSGNLWLLVGTDSAYESRTSLYYVKIIVRLNPYENRTRSEG